METYIAIGGQQIRCAGLLVKTHAKDRVPCIEGRFQGVMRDFVRFLRKATTVIKAVLFDLDDTLLDLNLTAFVGRYLFGLSGVLDLVANVPAFTLQPALATSFLELGCLTV